MTAPPSPILEAALALAARGWSVMTAAPRGKRALVPWRDLQDRPADAATLRRWFEDHPDANLAVVTGAVSGLVVLDVDPAHGGADSLARIEARHGPLPPTVECLTGGGGRHLHFAHPGGEMRNRAGLAPGLDLRGDGGMVVAPPSIHPSGNPYRWRPGRGPGEAPLAPLPDWLLDPREGEDRTPRTAEHWRTLAREGVAEGRRNDALASFTGRLLRHGIDPEVILELMLAWNRDRCRPPLSDAEVAATVRSIERTHRRRNHDEAGG